MPTTIHSAKRQGAVRTARERVTAVYGSKGRGVGEMKELTIYDPNISWAKHTIKVSFMIWGYKGYVTYKVGGNTKGLSLIAIDSDDLYDANFEDNPVNFRDLDEDWFSMELTNDKGDSTLVEDEFDRLGDYIVGVEIIAHEPE